MKKFSIFILIVVMFVGLSFMFLKPEPAAGCAPTLTNTEIVVVPSDTPVLPTDTMAPPAEMTDTPIPPNATATVIDKEQTPEGKGKATKTIESDSHKTVVATLRSISGMPDTGGGPTQEQQMITWAIAGFFILLIGAVVALIIRSIHRQ